MVELRRAHREELAAFAQIERDADTAEMILPYSTERHRREYERADIVYLSIRESGKLAGFFILALDEDGVSVEFRRIVVARKNAGIGQRAITLMEAFCRNELKRKRIWLDVFEHNQRARHVYQKLGYSQTGDGELQGKKLLYLARFLVDGD